MPKAPNVEKLGIVALVGSGRPELTPVHDIGHEIGRTVVNFWAVQSRVSAPHMQPCLALDKVTRANSPNP